MPTSTPNQVIVNINNSTQPNNCVPQPASFVLPPAAYMPQPAVSQPSQTTYQPVPVYPSAPEKPYHAALSTPTGGLSNPYPTVTPSPIFNPKQDSEAAEPSSTNSPPKSSQDTDLVIE